MAKKTVAAQPEVLPAESPEVALVKREAEQVASFIGSKAVFFEKAAALEKRAGESLATIKALALPKTAADDSAVKDLVRIVKADKKEVEDHWGICETLFQFHRRLTGARGRATKVLDEAVRIATGLHEDFVRAENARIQKEAEEKRRQEEARAAEARRQELEELERKALEAEADLPTLSTREESFVAEFLRNGGRATEAAKWAGYANAIVQGNRLVNTAKIQQAIQAKTQAEAIRQQAQATASAPLETREIVVESAADTDGDRKTRTGIVFDEEALIAAALRGEVPADLLTFNQAKLNEYARKIRRNIERWPGVRYNEKTSIV